MLSLGVPLLAWGAVACAIPVIIHLVHRQRPRRQVFPAMQLLLQSSRQATRVHRLKHLLLLLCRMAVVLLVVSLLAKTTWTGRDYSLAAVFLPPRNAPVSAVLCIDDSASMGYRYQGRTRLELAISQAESLLSNPQRFPPGSEAIILAGNRKTPAAHFSTDPSLLRRTLRELQPADHGRSLWPLIEAACVLFPSARNTWQDLYVLTDMSIWAWNGEPPLMPPGLKTVSILDVGQPVDHNLALSWPEVPRRPLAARQQETISVRVRRGDLPSSDLMVILKISDQVRDRIHVPEPAAGQEIELPVHLPPLDPGTHALSLQLEPQDALPADNIRFAAVMVGSPPQVVVVGPRADAEVCRMVSAMIDPPEIPHRDRLYTVLAVNVDDLTPQVLSRANAIILADALPNDAATIAALNGRVTGGASVIIIPGPDTPPVPQAAMESLLPAVILDAPACTEPLTLAAVDLSHPYLQPFSDGGTDSINERRVFRRLKLGPPAPGTRILAPFSDQQPAILERTLGTGRVTLLAFSPARTWSQFGTQAAPMLVLLHAMLDVAQPASQEVRQLYAGQQASLALPHPASTPLTLTGPNRTATVLPATAGGLMSLPTEQAGHYTLTSASSAEDTVLTYSVNVPPGESDPTRISTDMLLAKFPPGLARVAKEPDSLAQAEHRPHRGIQLTVPAGLGLLVLLLAETLLANRFYAPSGSNEDKSGPGN